MRSATLKSLAAALLAGLLLPAGAARAGESTPTVSLTAGNADPAVGHTFTVTVNLADAPPFANWGQYLRFDITRLKLVAQAAGSFATFVPDSRTLDDINASGRVHAGGRGLTDNAGGNGTLGVFTFRALAPGSTEIRTEGRSSTNPFGNALQPAEGGAETVPASGAALTINVRQPSVRVLTVTVAGSGSGSVTLDPAGGTYSPGTVVSLTAVPAAGSIFAGWSGDLTGTANPATLTMDADKAVTATFNLNRPPEISSVMPASPHTMNEGATTTFEVYADDQDGDDLDYSWQLDGGAAGTDDSAFAWTAPGGSAGPHTLTVTVTDGRGGSDSATWEITVLAPAPPPAIALSAADIKVSCKKGTDAPAQSFGIRNSGGGTLSYTVADGHPSWLDCDPHTGTSTGEEDVVTVTFASAGLDEGVYTATLSISDPVAGNSPQTIPVELTVNRKSSGSSSGGCALTGSAGGLADAAGWLLPFMAMGLAWLLWRVRRSRGGGPSALA